MTIKIAFSLAKNSEELRT